MRKSVVIAKNDKYIFTKVNYGAYQSTNSAEYICHLPNLPLRLFFDLELKEKNILINPLPIGLEMLERLKKNNLPFTNL
ncbi:hypothetical protein HZS_3529 [Henneguya salminicola]|nr:hypothetical protein HZS_3529 [Henneguya salminicola]